MDTGTGVYGIEKVNTRAKYEGLRALWCEVFGDKPGFVDKLYEAFGADLSFADHNEDNAGETVGRPTTADALPADITGYVATDASTTADALPADIAGYITSDSSGRVISSLTCYRCGALDGVPVYVTYAVCTDPQYRGLGLAGKLVNFVCGIVTDAGGLSLVSPADESLIKFYEELGYIKFFHAHKATAFPDMIIDDEDMDDEDFEPFEPGLSVMPVDSTVYNMYREAFLSGTAHIELSERMLEAVRAESLSGNGMYVINGGDAICTMAESAAPELMVNPMLMELSREIEGEIAARLAKHFGLESLEYLTPGFGLCQSMIAGDQGIFNMGERNIYSDAAADTPDDDYTDCAQMPPYFGFPLD